MFLWVCVFGVEVAALSMRGDWAGMRDWGWKGKVCVCICRAREEKLKGRRLERLEAITP